MNLQRRPAEPAALIALVVLVVVAALSGCGDPNGGLRSRGGRGRDAGPGGDAGSGGDDAATADAGPGAEPACNGIDDDRDGEVDEGCTCSAGYSQACYGGDPRYAGVGDCQFGSQPCEAAGEFSSWGACGGWIGPAVEVCGGGDENCDGTIDEGCGCSPGLTESCYATDSGAMLSGTPGLGACRAGARTCRPALGSSMFGACEGAIGASPEVCDNGLDDDCDGTVDEGCTCSIGGDVPCYESPGGAPLGGTPGVGWCRAGVANCLTTATGSALGSCVGAIGPGVDECGTGIDEDCDGVVDDGCDPPDPDCAVADVLFLVDVTGSMGGVIAALRDQLRTEIAPALDRSIGDLRMAVASFQDFPTYPYGDASDVPFQIRQRSTSDVLAVQSAIDGLFASGGGDGPEAGTEALYQAVTSSGLAGLVPPASCGVGGVGQACFRTGATPIIVLITDVMTHNGPDGSEPYSSVAGAHTYAEALSALLAANARVVGVAVNSSAFVALPDLQRVARDTNTLDAAGVPIVVDASSGSTAVVDGVVQAVRGLCGR